MFLVCVLQGYVRPIDIGKVSCEEGVFYCVNILTWCVGDGILCGASVITGRGLGADANKTAEGCRCCGKMRWQLRFVRPQHERRVCWFIRLCSIVPDLP